MIEDNSSDSDQNTSSFPLFNFEALKHSFPEVSHGQLNHQPIQIERDVSYKGSDAESSNKSSKPKKSKKSQETQNQKITMKDILEDIQSGVPMEADLKMKEDRLQKMREGKQRKKLLRQTQTEQASANPAHQIEKALESINNMTSITNIPQTLFNIPPASSGRAFDSVGRIVLKDGKPVVELPESTRIPSFERNNLITLQRDKPKKAQLSLFSEK